ncbi:hypothetical protein AAG747_11095 [Rapidithrix thailandica]|uniref:Uncharacterized protein n=1 Tax=Rapidithrix thailandica TaxID=413964 RepID=A0AAW9S7S1_9BACT
MMMKPLYSKPLILSRRLKTKSRTHHNNLVMSECNVELSGEAAAELIFKCLSSPQPSMICRFGYNELNCTLTYYFRNKRWPFSQKAARYIKGEIHKFWWDEAHFFNMRNNAGFFPVDEKHLDRFGKLMLEDIGTIDILGSWIKEERLLYPFFQDAVKVSIKDLEPYYHPTPWSRVLEGKKVLVIHPFEKSIRQQYAKRTRIFNDLRVLPEFELKTLKAIQSIANNTVAYSTWFDALQAMRDQISTIDFDIALIGCGAYGLPLAAHVKRLGKKAVHLGGATQILFGIKGKRWEESVPQVSRLFNRHWIRPSSLEVPQNYQNIEEGCYW